MKKQIICLGIYRSGTSLISGTLAQLGIDVGDHRNLSHPTANPWGYWEDEDLIALHIRLLELTGKKRFYDLEKDDCDKILDNPKANRIVKEYIKKRDEKEVWGVKDPRMIYFWKLFEKHLTHPNLIFIRRLEKSIIDSWKAVHPNDSAGIDKSYPILFEMLNEIQKNTKAPNIEIDYSWYIDNRHEAAKKIADFVGVPINQKAIDFCQKYSLHGKK
jgi:hypothetical protein